MAEDNDEASSTAQVASRLGREANQLTVARSNLIAKGLIYTPDHGAVRFTVPGMSGFISRPIRRIRTGPGPSIVSERLGYRYRATGRFGALATGRAPIHNQ